VTGPRVLPHRPDAENAILGGIMLRGQEALDDVLEYVTDDDFYQPRAQAVFAAMRALAARGVAIDIVTLIAELGDKIELVGGVEGLAQLDRHANAHNIQAHARLVAEDARVRKTVLAARDIAEEGMGEITDADAYLAKASTHVSKAAEGRSTGNQTKIGDLVAPVFESITARQRAGAVLTGVPTGLAGIDKMTAGLQPSDLIIIAARPSMGKTALGLNIAANASVTAQKHVGGLPGAVPHRFPVLFFSLEMSASKLTERIICSEARVDADRVRKGESLQKHEFEDLIRASQRISHAEIEIDDTSDPRITELQARARRWRHRVLGPPPEVGDPEPDALGLILVDYLQLVRGGADKYSSREQEISEISRGLKKMAKDLKLPVIALAQLNRKVDDRADHRPMLSDLRESGAIEQDADVIGFVYREERYLTDKDSEQRWSEVEGKAEVIIGKQRNGPIGTVPLTFVKKYTRFEDCAPGYE